MRALAFRSRSDKLAVQDIPATDPGPGQVKVAVEAASINGNLAAAVRAAAPEGVTAVVHAAGDVAALAALLSPGGRPVSALGATAEQAGRDDITVTGVMAVAEPEKFAALLASVAAGTLRVPVARTYPLDEAAGALADFSAHKLGKLAITVP